MADGQLASLMRYIRALPALRADRSATDGQLLHRFRAHQDKAAFATLLQRHGAMVFGVCRRILHDPHDAEDAFQAVFLVFVRKAPSIGRPDRLANWLYGVAYRTALKARAAGLKRRQRECQGVDMAMLPAPLRQDTGLREVLDLEVNRLPLKYRTPFVLCCLQGRTNEEAARLIGCPTGTVLSRLAWARERLRHRLSGRGVALTATMFTAALAESASPAAVPASLAAAAIQAAALGVAGKGAGLISAQVTNLSGEVVRAMFVTKFKITATATLVVSAMSAAAILVPYEAWKARGEEKLEQRTSALAMAPSDTPSERAVALEQTKAQPNDKATAAGASADTDVQRLQGRWLLVEQEHHGKRQAYPKGTGVIVGFRGNKYIVYSKGQIEFFDSDWARQKAGTPVVPRPKLRKDVFKLYPSRTPKAIDLVDVEDENKNQDSDFAFVTQLRRDRAWQRGIYSLEGDRLKICWNVAGQERPNGFATDSDGVVLHVFERAPATDEEPVPPKPVDDPRQRVRRWRIKFDPPNGDEFVAQLHALGAVLALPVHKDRGKYLVVHDLTKRPATGEVQSLADLQRKQRMFWVESDPERLKSLSRTLGLMNVLPEHAVIMLPQYVEGDLQRKAVALAGHDVDKIEETTFQVVRTGTGYELRVISQKVEEQASLDELKRENQRLRQQLEDAMDEAIRLRKELEDLKKATSKRRGQ
jgi:RNA polymerase sigma factor (sigma-70 family)